MKLGGSAILAGGAWLCLSACSGRYDMGVEGEGGTAGTGLSAGGGGGPSGSGSVSTGGTSPSPGGGTSSSGVAGSLNAGPGGPTPGPESTCGFTPITAGGPLAPAADSALVADRVYLFLQGTEAPDVDLPAVPSAGWAARLAEEILDAHFDAGTGVPGLEGFLGDYLRVEEPVAAQADWAAKLADPDASLATVISEPTGAPHRLGILTQPEVLALNPGISARGVWLNDVLFCSIVPTAPEKLPPLPQEAGLSRRQQLARELSNPVCVACHNVVDSPAYAFENFDDAGNYRELDNGVPVDASGTLVQGERSFESFDDLAPQLAEACEVAQCFSNRLSGYAGGRLRLAFSEAEANEIANAFADSGYSMRALVEAIVTSRAFFR